ncbi:MAG: GntR family transcriptional regulator, partial [Paracoccaceae bacterium]
MPSYRKSRAPQTRTEKVHTKLRQAILEQRLKPGTRLPEDSIGEGFGTSRTIAREALGRLAMEGLVDLVPNRGAFVANPSLDEGRDIFLVRKGLERLVMLQLAVRMSPDLVLTLQEMTNAEAAMVTKSEAE